MARVMEAKLRSLGKFRHSGIEVPRESSAREDAVEIGKRLCCGEERTVQRLQAFRELEQDAQNFRAFLFPELHELVVGLDRFERLDKPGLARSAGAVNNSGNAAATFGAQGDHQAFVAPGDVVFA